MPTARELLRQGRRDKIWKKYCGFIDLTLDDFMDIQRRLLLEQIHLLSHCELGRELLGEHPPTSVEQFREEVPLTVYNDYRPFLGEKREDVLPAKPRWWIHTSGRSGDGFKWVPFSEEAARKMGECSLATIMFASAKRRGEFVFEKGDTMLYALAPFPYMSGAAARGFLAEFDFVFLPPLEEAEQMEFQERIQKGFKMALRTGLDAFNGVASVLVKIGERFKEGAGSMRVSAELLNPPVLFRLIRALIRSRLDGRDYILPKDLWNVKCLGTGSTDTALFRGQIEEYWGRTPIEAYGSTEAAGILSVQTWNAKGLTFFPDVDFLEFIPEKEHVRSRKDPSYQPQTLLLDEVVAGERYELVITNFLGGVFTRYRLGDLIEITSLSDEETGIQLPQMVFYSRADGIIDLAAFTRLTERDIWRAIERMEVEYADWTARKEYVDGRPVVHVYLEPREDGDGKAHSIKRVLHNELRSLHTPYAELEDMLEIDPLELTLLPQGSFSRYYRRRQEEGADLAHLKPPHMNASDTIIKDLIEDTG